MILSSCISEVSTTYVAIFWVHLITIFEKLFLKVSGQFLRECPFLLSNDEVSQLRDKPLSILFQLQRNFVQ